MNLILDIARGHVLESDSPRTTNIYMNAMCIVCEKYLDDGEDILKGKSGDLNIIICKECAYTIHSAYEAYL